MANQTLKPFSGELDPIDSASGLKPFTGTLDGEKSTDGPLARGWNKAKQSMSVTSQLATGNAAGAAQTIKQADDYARANPGMQEGKELGAAWERGDGISGGISEVAGEFAKDWREAPGAIKGLRATGRNLRALGEGIVEQVPNMVAPVTGMVGGALAGGAAGSAAPIVGNVAGAAVGGWVGASAGNTLVEGGGMAQEALQKAGINPQDTPAVERFIKERGDSILGKAAVKGSIIGAVDTLTAGLGGRLLNAPARAAADRALAGMGVNMADKAAVKAATQSPEFAAKIAGDATYQASKQGAGNIARNVGAAALDPAGEFAGEFVGQGVATGEWDTKNAALEAFSSIGQSGAMFAGQKAYQALTRPAGAAEAPAAPAEADAVNAPTTEPGAVDPNAPAAQSVATPMPAPILDESVLEAAGVRPPAYINTRNMDRMLGDIPMSPTSDLGADSSETDTRTPSERMGINPAAGPLSRVAAVAVDSGASPVQFLGATGRDLQERATGPGVTNESNVIDVQGRLVEDRAISTPRRLTDQQDGMAARAQGDRLAFQPTAAPSAVPALGGPVGADAARGGTTAVPDGVADGRPGGGSAEGNGTGAAEAGAARAGGRGNSNPALSAPTNLREGLARMRARRQEAADAQTAAQSAPTSAPAVSTARPGAVEAAGAAPVSPTTTGVTSEPQTAQAQQSIAQPTQAGGAATAGPAAAATAGQSATVGGSGVQADGVDQLERERIDNEERIGKPALRSRIAEGREPKYEWNTQEGIYKAKASDDIVGGDVNAYKVKLTLTADEKRAVKRADGAMDLADTPEERAEARKELTAALRPAVDRALAEKTTPVGAAAPAIAGAVSAGGRGGQAAGLTAKRALYDAYKATGYPDDVVAASVLKVQEKADALGAPVSVWRGVGGTIGVVPAYQSSPFKGGELIATVHPNAASAKQPQEKAATPQNNGAQDPPAAGAQAQAPGNASWAALTPEQRRRARLEHEIATGQTNNGGVVAGLRPSAIEKRKQELAAMGDAGKLPSPGPAEPLSADGLAAQGTQGAAQAAQAGVAPRPKNWRTSMLGATPVAKAMGIDTKGKRLAQVVAEIDARDTQAPATPEPAPTPGPARLGRDNTPLSEGGKPFKTRKAAGDAKNLQPMMRVVTVPGGYALAEKTPAQLAAEERASRRLRNPNTSARGEPVPAHAFIAASGGLHMRHRNDLGVDGNPRIGNRRLFGGLNRGLSIEQATEMLVADGYLSEGASHNDAYALIKKSLSQPQYNADGIERIAQAESDAQFEDYMAAQEEASAEGDMDPFDMAGEFTSEELDDVGYTSASPALQAEVNALIAQADAMDIDTSAILEDIARTYANATQDQYNAAARDALAAAIARSNQDGGSVAAQAAPAAEPAAAQGLNRPSALTSQAQTATESVAPEALELAAQTPAEAAARQDAQEQADKAEAAAKRAEDAAAKAEEERKRIAQASVRAADSFELGQDPMDSLTGQGGLMFSRAPAGGQTETAAFKKLSRLFASPTAAGDMLAGGNEALVNSLKRNAEGLTNFLEGHSISAHGKGKVDIPASVVSHVLKMTDNKQVLGAIVRSLPVDVVDLLSRKQLTADHILHDKTMLENVLAVNGAANVSLAIDETSAIALLRSVARTATEIATNLAGGSLEGSPASRAGEGDSVFGTHTPKVTETAEFSKWFGDSKVVDAEGKPLVVYHGTTKDFDAFDQNSVGDNFGRDNDGFFFTGSAVEASGYADPQSELLAAGRPDARRMTPLAQANVMPVYLSIKNPLTLERYTWAIASSPEVEIDESGVSLIDFFDSGNGDVTRYAKEKGHDGVLFQRGGKTLAVAFFPEQIKSATGNNGQFDPSNPDIRFSFAGARAATADKHALVTAQDRLSAGEDAETVRQETGWFQGNDKKWRYEIDDSKAFTKGTGTFGEVIMRRFNAGVERTGDPLYKTTVGDVLYHPALFAAYPALAQMEVQMMPKGVREIGRVRRTEINRAEHESVIQIREDLPSSEWLSVMLHELQHGIQDIEGFATGGTPEQFGSVYVEELRQRLKWQTAHFRSAQKNGGIDPVSGQDENTLLALARETANELGKHTGKNDPRYIYGSLAGEVEARNTQARQGMTDAQRRATPPNQTADVADSDVIVVFNGKEMQNAPAPVNAEQSLAYAKQQLGAPLDKIRADSNARNVATQMLVDGLKEKWTRAPEIIVARNMQDPQVPQLVRDYDAELKSQGSDGEARGFIYKGKVYLLSDELKGPEQIAEVLFHEVLGHYGLRGAFGESLTPILQQIGTMRRRDVVAKAREYGLFDKDALGGMDKKTASVAQIWAAMSSKDRLSAAEEVLAEMAQTQPNISFVKRAIALIRNWLRSNVPGFKSLRLTDADIIAGYILPARGFVTRSKETGAQSLERAMMAFSRTSTATGTQSAWDAPVPTGFDDVIYKLQDKNIDLKRVVEAITKSAGQVADSVNAYLKEELFHKRAAKRVEDFGARELKPLMNQMRLMGLGMEDVEEYLHARHAKEANAVIAQRNPGEPGLQDGGSGMTNQAADNYFARLDPAQRRKLEAVAKNVDAIIDKTRKLYVSYGLENQDVVDGWASMYQHYIPLMREDKEGGMGTGQGFSVKGKETKGRTGSTRKVVDILANIASQRERLIVRGEKNQVTQALIGLARANPNSDFWEVRSQAPTERVFDPKKGVVVDRPDPLFKSRDNVVVAKVQDSKGNVTEQMVVFNEDNPRAVRMAAAMKNLDAGNLEGLLGMSAKITRYFSAINTQYNPVFGVVNLVRDVQGAMVNLAATPLAGQQGKIARDTVSALAGIYSDIRKTRKGGQASSKWAQLWEQMQDDGGTTGYRELFPTSADRANNLKSILNPQGWMDSKWGKVFTADGKLRVPMSMAQKGASEIFGWLSDYNEAMENGVRLAAYKAALDMGMSREQAASLAKNLTVNFNRKGQVGMQAGAVYAFFNAAMQGTARIGQTLFDMDGGDISTLRLSKTGKAVVYGGVTLGVMQALALAGAGFDEEDPPEFVRERSLIIPTGGKTYVSIPMPLGLHVIPGIGRHATEFALSGFDKPAKRALSVIGMFADAFNPIGNAGLSMQTLAPTALDPLVALTENKDWTGKPIARVSFNKAMPGHTQWKDTATWYSKMAAEAINWVSGGNEYVAGALSPTPDQIDYLIAQVGGGVAREASKVFQAASTTVNGEELPTYKIPLLGRFAGNAASQASQGTAFYANLDKLNALETEIKGLRKDGRFGEAAQLARENPQTAMIPMANRAERDVQKLRRDKRELIATGATREEVRAKEAQITAVMARLNEAAARRKATSPE